MDEVPVEVLEAGGVVPVKYVVKGKSAGVDKMTKKDLKEAPKGDEGVEDESDK